MREGGLPVKGQTAYDGAMVLRRCMIELSRLCAVWALLTPLTAWASPADEAPRGLRLPWALGAELEGVESTSLHAAGLSFMRGTEFGLGFSTGLEGGLRADGFAAMAAARFQKLGVGASFTRISEPGGIERATHRFDSAMGLRLHDTLGFGVRWLGLFAESDVENAPVHDFQSVSASLTWRPARAFSLGARVERLNLPKLEGETLQPIANLSLGFRPGIERVTFGVESRVGLEDKPPWSIGGNLRFMPIPGLTVGGYGRYARTFDEPDRIEWGGYLGFEQQNLSASVTLDRYDAASRGGTSSMSVGGLVKVSSERFPTLYVRPSGMVKIPINGPIAERLPTSPLEPDALPFGEWLVLLDVMASDPDLEGVLLEIGQAPSWGQIWELRQALKRLKAAGKTVAARLSWADMKGMYLASIADRIYLHPAGGLMLQGLSVTRTYFAGLMEKIGVRAQFIQLEDYKTAPEPLTRAAPSPQAKEQLGEILKGFDTIWRRAVSEGRRLVDTKLSEILESGPLTMEDAHTLGMVDRLVADDEIEAALSEDLNKPIYLIEGYEPRRTGWHAWGGRRRVAVIPVVGTIVNGKTPPFTVPIPLPFFGPSTGDVDIVERLKAAVADPEVVGIVVRVNSPGGAVLASDKMYRAVLKASEAKPLVVSFGNSAASGGYYLACGSSEILATPVTITGSIGIFTGKVDLAGLYDKIGISTDTQKTASGADAMGLHRPWTDAEVERARERLAVYYKRFVSLVSKARRIEPEVAGSRARGRVYLGERAMALELVDQKGSLWDAVRRIRELAKVRPEESLTLDYGVRLGVFERLLVMLGVERPRGTSTLEGLSDTLRPVVDGLSMLLTLHEAPLQARLPFHLEVQ